MLRPGMEMRMSERSPPEMRAERVLARSGPTHPQLVPHVATTYRWPSLRGLTLESRLLRPWSHIGSALLGACRNQEGPEVKLGWAAFKVA